MLTKGASCYVLIPNERNVRLLVAGRVVELTDAEPTIQLDESIPLQNGADTTLFAEVRGKFLQQAAVVLATTEEIMPVRPGSKKAIHRTTLRCKCVGEPVSAESRGSFRVSVAGVEIAARVDSQDKCQLIDISPEGCGVICKRPLVVGHTVPVRFQFEDVLVEGMMKVQAEKGSDEGQFRFGLMAPEKGSACRRGLEKLSMLMQRRQLRRVAGAA